MSKEQQTRRIQQRFPTESYKQFFYQTRPFFTMGMAVVLIALGWLQIVNPAVISWILAAFVLDNVALTPIMSSLRAINNLLNGRKKLKSKLMLAAVITSLISGALLGYFVLMPIPLVSKLLLDYIALTGCSPFLISLGAMIGAYMSHSTHKIPLFWGIFVGSCIASVIYIPIPIVLELVYFSAVAVAFFATIATKQSLRRYYKQQYGHSNADGYEIARSSFDQDIFIKEQSLKFQVKPSEFIRMTEHCRKKIAEIKNEATYWEEYSNARRHKTNSYKDIYHGLMSPAITLERVKIVKKVIVESNLPPEVRTVENTKKVTQTLRLGTFFNPDLNTRMTVHQYQISDTGGLESTLQKAFQTSP